MTTGSGPTKNRSGGASQLATSVWESSHEPAALIRADRSASPRNVALASAPLTRPHDHFSLKDGSTLTDMEPLTLASTEPLQLKFERKSRGARAACTPARRAAAETVAAEMLPSGTASIKLAGTVSSTVSPPSLRSETTLARRPSGVLGPTSSATKPPTRVGASPEYRSVPGEPAGGASVTCDEARTAVGVSERCLTGDDATCRRPL